jgi:hypothetical protein
MAKAVARTKTLGMKLTEEEYARLVVLAGNETVSEWARAVLLGQSGAVRAGDVGEGSEVVLLGELLALRSLMLNLLYALSRGEKVSEERMRELLERADGDKHKKARERLSLGARR